MLSQLLRKQTGVNTQLLTAAQMNNLRQRKSADKLVHSIVFLCAILGIFVTIGIIVSLFSETIGFFARPEVNLWDFFTGTDWRPLASEVKSTNFGIRPLVRGTMMIAIISGAIAIPIGLAGAIFLSEYASNKLRKVLKPAIEILAGIPTVVYGYFAISFVTPVLKTFVEETLGGRMGFFNVLSASIVVGIMIIPMVTSISEDAMHSVPRSLREGAYALGATKFEVATRVVVPAALSGIISAFIIALSRAIGETMAVTIAAGATPRMTLNPLESVQTMTAFIVQVSFGDAPQGTINSQSIFAVGATLFSMTFLMNIISNRILNKFREVYE
jgi:phosphate transport system permease protein